jgi:polar amino acid transport system permease protein
LLNSSHKNKSLKFSIIDIAAIVLIIAAIFMFFSRMNSVLEYNWEWSAIPNYFFFWDAATGELKANILARGFITTIKLSIWATLIGFFLGQYPGSWEQKALLNKDLFLEPMLKQYAIFLLLFWL